MALEFEAALDELDKRLERAQEAAEGLLGSLKRGRKAVAVGNVTEIIKAISGLHARLDDSEGATRDLSAAWAFDTTTYMLDGRYLADLLQAAAEQKLEMFERDGRIYCFPLLLRIDAGQSALRVGRKVERRIRPRELVRLLAKLQRSPQRFSEQRFLDLVWRTYRRLLGRDWSGTGPGRVVALIEIHETLTLLPGSEYSQEEYVRDLIFLDRRPDLRTRSGESFEFPHGSTTRGIRPLIGYDEHGAERTFYGIRFVAGG